MGHVVSRSQRCKGINQAEFFQQVFDFSAQTPAGNGKGKLARHLAHEIDCAGKRGQPVTNGFPVGARLPRHQLVAPRGVERAAMAGVKVLHNSPVVESEVIAVVHVLCDSPTLPGRHFLGELQNQWLAVYDDPVKVKYDYAQQIRALPMIGICVNPAYFKTLTLKEPGHAIIHLMLGGDQMLLPNPHGFQFRRVTEPLRTASNKRMADAKTANQRIYYR